MFNLLKSPAPPERSALLSAKPRRNSLVQEVRRDATSLRLSAPLRPTFLRKFLNKPADSKSFDLDALGTWVWDRVDGRLTVGKLIESFAADHRLNLREAEVSVLAFLKMLTQRNLIALIAPKSTPATPRSKKKKKKH